MMKKKSRRFWVPALMLAMAAVFATITMLLWNALLPRLFGLPVLSWLEALGLLALCRVLFGGISGGFGRRAGIRHIGCGGSGENLFRGRWGAMSDEQRRHLAEEIRKRHGFDPLGGFCAYGDSGKRDDAGTPENTGAKKE